MAREKQLEERAGGQAGDRDGPGAMTTENEPGAQTVWLPVLALGRAIAFKRAAWKWEATDERTALQAIRAANETRPENRWTACGQRRRENLAAPTRSVSGAVRAAPSCSNLSRLPLFNGLERRLGSTQLAPRTRKQRDDRSDLGPTGCLAGSLAAETWSKIIIIALLSRPSPLCTLIEKMLLHWRATSLLGAL